MHVPPYAVVGARVAVKGNHAGGPATFVAEVVGVRSVFPPLIVRFCEDAAGSTHPLALPQPVVAYVHHAMVSLLS